MPRSALRTLAAAGDLDPVDTAALETLTQGTVRHDAGTVVVGPGQDQTSCHLLLDGMALRSIGQSGRRQITNFLLPGDLVDLHPLFYGRSPFSIVACTDSLFALIGHADLSALMAERRNISDALWRMTLRDAAIEREWVLNIARRSTEERIAHLLSEIVMRLAVVEPAADRKHVIPLSSLMLAEAVNCPEEAVDQVLLEFKHRGFLETAPDRIVIEQVQSLQILAGFDPTYLSLDASGRLT